MSKHKLLVIGSSDRLCRRLNVLLDSLSGISLSYRNDCTDIEAYFSNHRFDAVLLEYGPNFDQDIVLIHYLNPSLPVLVYADNNLDHARTRLAFLSGAADALNIRSASTDAVGEILENILNPMPISSMAENEFQLLRIKSIAKRGESLMRQMLEGKPPPFYMNGNRATLLRVNVLSLSKSLLWQQEAAWGWIQEFGASKSFMFKGSDHELRLAAIVEQNYVNNASFNRMLNARLCRYYDRINELGCVCVAAHCSSDYLSLPILHHLDNLTELVFYMDKSQTIQDSVRSIPRAFPSSLYSEFCSAVVVRDVSAAIDCVDRVVLKLQNDLPSPAFARIKLSRFLWELASVIGSRGDQMNLCLDDSHILLMRNDIVEIIRMAMTEYPDKSIVSPLDELIHRIETNPGTSINIDQAAEEVNFSRSHFCRLFRQQTGLSFTAFLTKKRIEMACDLLTKTSMRVDEVASIVGINNTYYFKKLFERETGLTVEDWGTQNRQAGLNLNSPESDNIS